MAMTSTYLAASASSGAPLQRLGTGLHLSVASSWADFSSMRVELHIVLHVLLGLAALHFVERRLGDVDVAALQQLRHLPVEEGEQQRADVGAVHVRVGHDDDAVVAQLVGVELFLADAAAERGDERAHFLRREHLVEARLLHVEDLALQRQDRLELAVAALLGGAACGVALDDEDLAEAGVFLLAVGELAGQARYVQHALAAGHLAGLARGFAGAGRLDDLGDDDLGFRRLLQQELLELLRHQRFHHALHFRRDQLVLGLAGELGVRQLHRDDGGEALAGVVAGHGDLLFLEGRRLLDEVVERARQCGAETGQVRAAVALRDVVGEAVHRLLVGVVPLHRHFHGDLLPLGR